MVVTVAAVPSVTALSANEARDDFELGLMRTSAFAVATVIGRYLDVAMPVLSEARHLAEQDVLEVDDSEALGSYFVELVRQRPAISFLMYGDQATGRFIGAWRRGDGAIVLARSSPEIDGGRRSEWEVTDDGDLVPYERDVAADFDPRKRPWYVLAAGSQDLVWTPPYHYFSGGSGITAAYALRQPDSGRLRGVFAMDFSLQDASTYLEKLSRGRSRVRQPFLAVFDRDGGLIASSYRPDDSTAAAAVRAALDAAPAPLDQLPLTQLVPFDVRVQSVAYGASLQAEKVGPGLESIVVTVGPSAENYQVVYEADRFALGVGFALVTVAAMLCFALARRISHPLAMIAADLQRVGQFDLTTTPSPRSFIKEIVVVSDAVDRMKASLRSFSHYVPRELVQEALASGEEARLGGQNRIVTIYFSDIAGFTSISESMPPADLVELLSEYLAEMTRVIEAQHGVVDKFIGDGIMALFNAPRERSDHPVAACRAALRSQESLRALRDVWAQQGRPRMRARIGLHCGEVIVGNIGTPDRFDYTVTGDAVNVASRLEQLNKVYGTEIMASAYLREAAGSAFEWRALDRVAVVGRDASITVSELLGEAGAVNETVLQARDCYEDGLHAYLAGQFREAAGWFEEAARLRPDDGAAPVMVARARRLAADAGSTAWDGVFRATSKEP
jgi:adenylate cyclase